MPRKQTCEWCGGVTTEVRGVAYLIGDTSGSGDVVGWKMRVCPDCFDDYIKGVMHGTPWEERPAKRAALMADLERMERLRPGERATI